MNGWIYKGHLYDSPDDTPTDYFGFVYRIRLKDGRAYIGQKQFWSTVTIPALKSGEVRPNATRIRKRQKGKLVPYDVINKPSNWVNYCGSSKNISKEDILDKEILKLCKTKRSLTYQEAKMLFELNVLANPNYINDNILGKFYDNCIEKEEE